MHRSTHCSVIGFIAAVATALIVFTGEGLAQTPGLGAGNNDGTNECRTAPSGGGTIICNGQTYPLPAGQTRRNNISYWLYGSEGTDRDYTIDIDGDTLGVLHYLAGDTSVEGGADNAGKPGVIDIHGGHKVNDNDSLSDMDLTVNLRNAVIDATAGHSYNRMSGIVAMLGASSGDLRLNVRHSTITANRQGLYALHDGAGGIFMDLYGSTILTKQAGNAVDAWHDEFGDVTVTVRNSVITTEHANSVGIRAFLRHNDQWDDVNDSSGPDFNQPRATDRHNVRVIAENTSIFAKGYYGVYAKNANYAATRTSPTLHPNTRDVHGDVIVDWTGGEIVTEEANGTGIFAWNIGKGDVTVNVRDAVIRVKGASATQGAYGIWGYNEGGAGAVDISMDGGTIFSKGTETTGNLAAGIYLSGSKVKDSAGYLRQTARINGIVNGGAAGVRLDGGGRVFIGPRGRISGGLASGPTAILATGDDAKLLVSMDLAGGNPSSMLGGAIVNSRGTGASDTLGATVLVVNGATLFNGSSADGLTGRPAPNGVWDLWLRPAVDTGTAGQVSITLGNGTATRAARGGAYESLPGFLAALNSERTLAALPPPGAALADGGSRRPPLWVRVSGDTGQSKPERSRLGSSYRYNDFRAETGMDFRLGGDFTLSGSLRMAQASGTSSVPAGKGKMRARGYGAAIEGVQQVGDAWVRGRAEATQYSIKMSTAADGTLASGEKALGLSFGLKAGRRLELDASNGLALSPMAWLRSSRIEDISFTDRAYTRLSIKDGSVAAAGAGATLEMFAGQDETLRLRGFVGVETALDRDTSIEINGDRYDSSARRTQGLLSLGARMHMDNGLVLDATMRAQTAGADNTAFGGTLRLSMRF